jgi:modulator of FtsH protease
MPVVCILSLLGTVVFGLSMTEWKNLAAVNGIIFTLLCLSTGAFLGLSLSFVGSAFLPLMAAGSTLILVLSLIAYVLSSRRDFSFLRWALCSALVTMLCSSAIGGAFGATWVDGVCNAIGIVVFSGGILMDTSALLEAEPDDTVIGAAFSLYWSVLCLFVSLIDVFWRSCRGNA